METFLEWLRLSEANANDRTLINYALRIESDPKLDDLETMLSMLKKHSEGLWPLGAIGMLLIRMKTVAEKLPEPDNKSQKNVNTNCGQANDGSESRSGCELLLVLCIRIRQNNSELDRSAKLLTKLCDNCIILI